VRNPEAVRIEASVAAVEPLPLVPAISTEEAALRIAQRPSRMPNLVEREFAPRLARSGRAPEPWH
jgi:hypothetical protein